MADFFRFLRIFGGIVGILVGGEWVSPAGLVGIFFAEQGWAADFGVRGEFGNADEIGKGD